MLLCLCASIAVLGSVSASALAALEYIPAGSFGEACSSKPCAPGKLTEPTGVAVDDSGEPLVQPAAGDVYVIDTGNARVERFNATGTYLSEWTGAATVAKSFSFSSSDDVQGIAVDNSGNPLDPSAGDVYVADVGHKAVVQFTSAGAYTKLELTGTCAAPGTCPGKVIPFPGELLGVAVDSSGDVWVAESEKHFDEFSDTGAFMQTFESGREVKPGLAVDASGNLYQTFGNESAGKFEAGAEVAEFGQGVTAQALVTASNDVLLDKGSSIERFAPISESKPSPLETFAGGDLAESHGIAVNGASAAETVYASQLAAGSVEIFNYVSVPATTTEAASNVKSGGATLNGMVTPGEAPVTNCEFDYGTSESYGSIAPCAQTPSQINTSSKGGEEPVPVTAEVSGLSPDARYHFRLVAASANGTKKGLDIIFGPPTIESQLVVGTGSFEAKVGAEINPEGVPTTYRVEYGTSSAYGSSTSETSLGAGFAPVEVQVRLPALQPGTEYHFRFVASNPVGAAPPGGDATFTTTQSTGASASALPDARVYELVSPVTHQNVYVPARYESEFGLDLQSQDAVRAAAGGEAVIYAADPPALGGTGQEGSLQGNVFIAKRTGEGWSSTDIMPLHSGGAGSFYRDYSKDLSKAVFWDDVTERPKVGGAPCDEFFLWSSTDDALHPFFTEQPEVNCIRPEQGGYYIFAGASTDYSHLLFEDATPLTPNAVAAEEAHSGGRNLYDDVNGQPQLVNVLPGVAPEPVRSATYGGLEHDFSNVISSDGSRVFWTDLEETGEDAGVIFVRENDTSTVRVSAGPATYWTASPDGRYAFYTEGEKLWRFDVESETREAIVNEGLSHGSAGVQGLFGINETGEDGAYIYVVANGELASNENSHGDRASVGAPNLYLLHGGQTTFIATLAPGQAPIRYIGERTEEVAPNGHSLGFTSTAGLTGYENRGQSEVYVYDADSAQLSCASCDPSGAPPSGTTTVPRSMDDYYGRLGGGSIYMERWLSEDGGRVFFDSSDALLPQAINGLTNVYEWERDGDGSCQSSAGCLYLLTGGDGPDLTYFEDASSNGDDAFVLSRENLTTQARNETMKLYDVRVDGYKPPAPPACTGTGCQGVPAAPPVFATPASVTFAGVGNFPPPTPTVAKAKPAKPKKCKKGQVKRKGKCVKKAKAKKKARKSTKGSK